MNASKFPIVWVCRDRSVEPVEDNIRPQSAPQVTHDSQTQLVTLPVAIRRETLGEIFEEAVQEGDTRNGGLYRLFVGQIVQSTSEY